MDYKECSFKGTIASWRNSKSMVGECVGTYVFSRLEAYTARAGSMAAIFAHTLQHRFRRSFAPFERVSWRLWPDKPCPRSNTRRWFLTCFLRPQCPSPGPWFCNLYSFREGYSQPQPHHELPDHRSCSNWQKELANSPLVIIAITASPVSAQSTIAYTSSQPSAGRRHATSPCDKSANVQRSSSPPSHAHCASQRRRSSSYPVHWSHVYRSEDGASGCQEWCIRQLSKVSIPFGEESL